jgi:hypothetical protein
MTNTPARSAQPGEKPAYVPPRVMRLGDLNEGAGACAAGSGVVTGNCEPSGGNATGPCDTGTQADTNCIATGLTAVGICDGTGSSATTGSCNAGSGI